MRAGVLVLGAALLLGGCATGGVSEPRTCSVDLAATLPMLPSGHVVVEGKLNQQPAVFVLDTGAERSSVTPYAVRHDNLGQARGVTRITGVGGVFVAPTVFANVELGGVEVRRQVPVVELPLPRGQDRPLAGLIGADLLSSYDLEVSFPEERVRLWRTQGCSGDYVPWSVRHWSVPLQRTGGGRLTTPVLVNGQRFPAMLDSGANTSLLSGEVTRRLGISDAEMAADRRGEGRGADGNAIGARAHRFAELRVGPERFGDIRLNVTAGRFSESDMLLGADWMRRRPVWVSWSSRQMFVQPLPARAAAGEAP